jgi:hypothetical protein
MMKRLHLALTTGALFGTGGRSSFFFGKQPSKLLSDTIANNKKAASVHVCDRTLQDY